MTGNDTSIQARPMPVPTPKQIDQLIAEYAEAQKSALAAKTVAAVVQEKADKLRAAVVEMVETHGKRHTEKSKRLQGIHHTATTTTATRMTVDAAAVDAFKHYLEGAQMPELVEKFFRQQISYSLVDGPQDVLKTLSLGKRIRDKVTGLLGSCFRIVTNAPSLKIDVAEVETPANSKAG